MTTFTSSWKENVIVKNGDIAVVTILHNLRIVYNVHVFLLIVYSAQQFLLIVYNEQHTCALYTMSKTTKLRIEANAQGVRKFVWTV